MAVTSAVLLACFWVDLLASLSNVVRFGVLVGAIVILALLADFLVAPALMRWMLEPRRSFVPRLARAASVLLAAVRVAPVARRADLVLGEPIAIDPARAIMQRVQARDDGEFMNMELETKRVDRRRHVSEQRARFPWELE
jgi:hypothetical protein